MENYYEILGVQKNATEDEIKKAYRSLAFKYHPDRNPGDKTAEETFKKITVAYDTLSDPVKKRDYDLGGSSYSGTSSGNGNYSYRSSYTGENPFGSNGPFGSWYTNESYNSGEQEQNQRQYTWQYSTNGSPKFTKQFYRNHLWSSIGKTVLNFLIGRFVIGTPLIYFFPIGPIAAIICFVGVAKGIAGIISSAVNLISTKD